MSQPQPSAKRAFDRGHGPETLRAWLHLAEKLYAREDVAVGQSATDAHDEALYLLLRTLALPLDSEPAVLDRRLSPGQSAKLDAVLHRRIFERVPAAYLLQEAWLGEHRFYVDERVIIPRSYFLEIIPGQLDRWLPRGRKVQRALDVCTGSACLAILLAHHFKTARIDACDLSGPALEVAALNIRAHRLARRVRLYRSDLLRDVPPARYDVIISNPPYEPSALVATQAPEFAAEPRLAHDGGRDGLVVIRRLISEAAARLQPHGILAIEVGGLRTAINREFRSLQPHWLPTKDGSNCVVLFRASELVNSSGTTAR